MVKSQCHHSIHLLKETNIILPSCLRAAPALCYLFMRQRLYAALSAGAYLAHIVPVRSSEAPRARACVRACVLACGWGVGSQLYLRVEWRWQISELCDVCLERSQVVVVSARTIAALQAVAPLGLRYGQVAVARRRCKGEGSRVSRAWDDRRKRDRPGNEINAAGLSLLYTPSGLSWRPSQLSELQLLLMLEVRVAQACRGMVPITRGRERDRFRPPGTSTYTCGYKKKQKNLV